MTLKNFAVWYGILHKRLIKRVSFLLILAGICLVSLLLSRVGQEGQGLFRVAVAAEDGWNGTTRAVAQALEREGSIVSVTLAASRQEAVALVESDRADTAWILDKDLAGRLEETARGKTRVLATILSPEEDMFTKASQEKLFGALFRQLSYAMYEAFVQEHVPDAEGLSPETLRETYDSFSNPQGLVSFRYLDRSGEEELTGYLLSPLRGILATLMLVAGLAATMYYKQDEKNGVYGLLTPGKQLLVLFCTNFIALCMTALCVTLSLVFLGLYQGFWRETAGMLVLVLAATGFCSVLGVLCPHTGVLGAVLPVAVVAAMAFCPVFFNVKRFVFLRMLLPPNYYLYGMTDGAYLWQGLLFFLISSLLAVGLYSLARRRSRR